MGTAKPTLGYPSRTEAVLGLRSKGHSTREIAAMVGIAEGTVGALEASAKKARKRRPSEQNGRTVVFPIDTLDLLRPHADCRGITVNELVRRIIDVAAEERLIDSILDDEVTA